MGFEIRACDSIIYTNENGQVVNIARSTGTDYDNRDKISTSIQSNGMQVDVLPPVILNDGTSVDGFTRGSALKKMGMEEWIYLVVDLKNGCNIEDLKDEIGLGCNNHSPSKPATLDDFESAFVVGLIDKNLFRLLINVLHGGITFRTRLLKRVSEIVAKKSLQMLPPSKAWYHLTLKMDVVKFKKF